MKRLLYIVLIMCLLSSCKKDDKIAPIFDKPVNQRTEEFKSFYADKLIEAPNGWATYYVPNAGSGGFRILMKFDKEGNVTMASDFKKGKVDGKSTYRIDKTLKAELIFETKSIFSEITEIAHNGVQGEFQFNILEVKDDKILLESKTDNGYGGGEITRITLEKATAEDWDFTKVIENGEKVKQGYNTQEYFRKLYVEGSDYIANVVYQGVYDDIRLTRFFSIEVENDKGVISKSNHSIVVTPEGFNFVKPLIINGKEVSKFTFDDAKNKFVSQDSGLTTIIEYSETPVINYFPATSVGEDPNKGVNIGFYEHFLFHQIQDNTTDYFKDLWKKSGYDRIFIKFNTDEKGEFSEKKQAVLLFGKETGFFEFKYPYKIPLKVARISNKKIIFEIEGKVSDYVVDTNELAKIQPFVEAIATQGGFYVESTVLNSFGNKLPLFTFINTVDTSKRIAFLQAL